MTRDEFEVEEYGEHLLKPLRSSPPIDPQVGASIKENFIHQAEIYREEQVSRTITVGTGSTTTPTSNRARHSLPWVKVLVGTIIVLVIMAGSIATTVSAAQNSLPGELLYSLKSLTEDIRITMSSSPQSKLDLTLNYTDRRVGEITSLLAGGKTLPVEASERFNGELESVLQLAAQMDDTRMKYALGRIKHLAENQGMTIEELVNMLPVQADPAITRLRQRLQEQVELSQIGEADPQAFRFTIHERERMLHQTSSHKSTPNVGDTITTQPTPLETKDKPGNGNNKDGQSSDVPGHDGSPPGQGGFNPGNSNHEPNNTPVP